MPATTASATSTATSRCNLHRLPEKEWIGFEVVNHNATDGIAIGECYLYDQQGPIGTSTVAALAQRKPLTKPATT